MKCEQILRAFLDQHAAILLLDLDARGYIQNANDFTCRFFGEDPSGKSLAEVFLDFRRELDFEAWLKAGDERRMLNLPRPDGLPQTFYVRLFPHENGVFAIGEVNTEEIESLRNELVRSNNELHNLTRDLQKKKVELERLNELKNHFLGMAAHDLRNPLSVIMAYSEFMLSDHEAALKNDHVNFLNDIRYMSEFMLSLINDLLDISALESGKLQPKYELGYLPDLIFKVVSVHRPMGQRNHIEVLFESRLPNELSLFDEHRLRQVLNNLIGNAIKFSAPGTQVLVEAMRTDDQLHVSVTDQGPGIPEAEQDRLFQPFPQISVKSKGKEKSTGLGLAITQKIVTSMQGTVWAKSRVGVGSTFHFQIPWLVPEEAS